MGHEVVEVTPELLPGAADAVSEGFQDNEIWVWLLRRDWQRRRLLPRHYRAMLRRVYIPRRSAWTTADTLGGALWLPPGTLGMGTRERMAEVLSLLPEGIGSFPRATRWEELISKHHPHEPHWYLQALSVRPEAQRSGVGSALIRPGLERADAEGVPAYLETQREANVPFYRRFGFELTDKVQLHDSPPLWLMWRPAGTSSGRGG